jgi:hypothetical protein
MARKQKKRATRPKTVLRIPDLEHSKNAVLGYKAQKLSLQGIEASSTYSMQIFFPWEVSKPFTGASPKARAARA